MATLISSQRFVDDEIVAQKITAHDFGVQLSPVFVIDGEEYQVVMDGHHSYHAALEASVEPTYHVQNATENDRISLLNEDVNLFLEACYHEDDWYDIKEGYTIW
jgi:hypothetical protein